MIKVTPAQLRIIKTILAAHVPGVEARAFGSRVDGSPKAYSDLDLALIGPSRLDSALIEALKEAFAESDLPFRVDVLDLNAVSEEFSKIVLRKYEVLQPRKI
ncbi:MAG: nucleotidyltransferase domain-containing protein [Elusimicrobiales bacterium]|nr:nucleotidyltransferase domain-containing protein [Elusimicrobiales bacterium]